MSDLIDRLRSGFSTEDSWTQVACRANKERSEAADALEAQAKRLKELEAECKRLADVPMKYKRMEFNAQLQNQVRELEAENARLRADLVRKQKGLDAVCALMDESHGVAGLHLNGDIATWDSLRTGGEYEGWLIDFDAAKESP